MLVGSTPANWPWSTVMTSKRLRGKQPETEDNLEPKGSPSVSTSCGGRKRATGPGGGECPR